MKENFSVETDMASNTVWAEANGEFTLPDYMPEVRRVLRVDCNTAVTGQYKNGDKEEFGGECHWHLIYTDGEGNVAAAPLDATFECSVPGMTEAKMIAVPVQETATCRLSGPRRVGMKANIALRPVACRTTEHDNPLTDEEVTGETALLCKPLHTARTEFFRASDITVSESVRAERDSTILTTDGNVLVREVRCESGGVRVRGEVWLNALCSRADAGMPYVVKVKIPLEEFVPADGVTPDDSGIAWGNSRSLSATISEGEHGTEVTFDATVDIIGMAVANETVTPVCDMYSVKCPLHINYRIAEGRRYIAVQMGNYTVDGNVTAEMLGCREMPEPVDVRGCATVSECHAEGEEVTIEGEIRLSCILRSADENGEYTGATVPLPYKVHLPLKEEMPGGTVLQATVSCVGCHAHSDGSRMGVECELGVTLVAGKTERLEIVERAEQDRDNPYTDETGEIIAAYLENGDSLWSVGRRYHILPEELVQGNSLPQEMLETPDAPYQLDGLSRLMLER